MKKQFATQRDFVEIPGSSKAASKLAIDKDACGEIRFRKNIYYR